MRVRPLVFAVLVVVIFLAPVAVASSAGLWATTGQPAGGHGGGGGGQGGGGQGTGGGGGEGAGQGKGGEGAGQGQGGEGQGSGGGRVVLPGEARGWMTIAQVAGANGIEPAEILAAFGLPEDTDPATALRDLESETFSVAALRAWLAERTAP